MLGTYKNLSIAKENRPAMAEKGVLRVIIQLLKSLFNAKDELYAWNYNYTIGKTSYLNA